MLLSADEEIERRYETTEGGSHNYAARDQNSWSRHKSKSFLKKYVRVFMSEYRMSTTLIPSDNINGTSVNGQNFCPYIEQVF
jgi:hypothetical protein